MKKIPAIFTVLVFLLAITACSSSAAIHNPDESGLNQQANAIPERFVNIPGGTFMMGPAPMAGLPPENPPQVTISPFQMGVYPVTQREYLDVMGTNPSEFKYENQAVEKVSWFDAIDYCNRLNILEGLEPVYIIEGTTVIWDRSAKGYRLPTEAEWEYAARAGANTPFSSTEHPWGLCDMPAELWEWCWDWFDSYPSGALTDPSGADSGTSRVLRAGNYGMCEPRGVIVRLRSHSPPAEGGRAIGFRVVRS